ncbi:MAG: DNA-formamidopyrimidine glycosylase family protein [Acidobacteriota bacterium]
MPELPDIVAYIQALEPRIFNQPIQGIRLSSPFLLRSVVPPLSEASGKQVINLRRLVKRIVFGLEDDLFLIIHLMIAGRFHWKEKPAKPSRQTISSIGATCLWLVLT